MNICWAVARIDIPIGASKNEPNLHDLENISMYLFQNNFDVSKNFYKYLIMANVAATNLYWLKSRPNVKTMVTG